MIKHRMIRHLVKKALPALALSVALFLVACGSEPQAGVVEVWATWASMPEETLALFDRYSQETGIQVKVKTGLKGSKIVDRLAGSAPPDLLLLSNGDLVASLADQGLITPLNHRGGPAAVKLDDVFPAALAQCADGDGRLLCLPWGSDVQVLYWNKTLFRAAGLDPDRPPATMEELQDLAMQLTRRDQAGNLVQVGFIPDLPGSHSRLFAHLLGAVPQGRNDATPAVDAASLKEALAWQQSFYDFYEPGQLEELVAGFTPHRTSSHPVFAGARLGCQTCHRDAPLARSKTPAAGFLGGQIAMMVDGAWLAAPDVAVEARSQVDFGVAPFPASAAAPRQANTSLVQGPVLVIPSTAVDREAAEALLAWLSAPEVQAEAAFHNGLLPSSRAAAQDPAFHQSPAQEMLLDLLSHPNAIHRSVTPEAPAVNALLGDVEDVVFHTDQAPASMLVQLQDGLP